MSLRRSDERGFAMLLVFALAAAIAIMLYQELPRAAFEAQRMKEEMVIERGEQYKRAIQLYVSAHKRYPSSIDDLEKTGNVRYLRKRYVDPLTGKDEWRLIRINAAGVLVDSIVNKPAAEEKAGNVNTFVTEHAAVGSSQAATGPVGVNPNLRRRPSDQARMPAAAGEFAAGPPPFPPDPNNPQPQGQPYGQGQQFGQPQQFVPGTQPGQPGQPFSQQFGQPPLVNQPNPNFPGGGGLPPAPGQPAQSGQPQPYPYPVQPGQAQPFPVPPGQAQPFGGQPGQAQPFPVQPGQPQPFGAQPGQP
ncbi:MAG: hypothetical protein HYZ57_05665, partial [Acidobacteria bacterium]|nr:hypothetical protein [Acidobacteriota bacterium]